jgi:hypothetical protein
MTSTPSEVCAPDNIDRNCAAIGTPEAVADVRHDKVDSVRVAYLRGLVQRIDAGLPVAGMHALLDPETIGNHLQKRPLSECPQAASNLMALAALAGTISEFPGANS